MFLKKGLRSPKGRKVLAYNQIKRIIYKYTFDILSTPISQLFPSILIYVSTRYSQLTENYRIADSPISMLRSIKRTCKIVSLLRSHLTMS
jgi:hypothetical protein